MTTKRCFKCKGILLLNKFSWKNRRRKQYSSECKSCHKKYRKTHYEKNKKYYMDRAKTRKIELYNKLVKYKQKKKCLDCGISDWRVLDFDHLPKYKKLMDIGKMLSLGYAWEKILKEIKKCEIVCSNCHRIRTFERSKHKSRLRS